MTVSSEQQNAKRHKAQRLEKAAIRRETRPENALPVVNHQKYR